MLGVLMMAHLVYDKKTYLKTIKILYDQGIRTVIIMDSAEFFFQKI